MVVEFIFMFLTLLCMSLLASFIYRFFPTMIELKESNKRYGSIDGLRGYLALGVFIHHFIITYYWKVKGDWIRPPEDFFNNLGQSSVAIFFMITGFLFTTKTIASQYLICWRKFYINRFFRIVPLYAFIVGILFFIVALETHFTLNISVKSLIIDVLKWGLFKGETINGYLDTRVIIAGVDWTLKYEWLFYLIFPLVIISLKHRWVYIFIIVASFVGMYFPIDIKLFIWFFNSQFFILFILGIISGVLSQYEIIVNSLQSKVISLVAVFALGVTLFLFQTSFGIFQALLLSIFFIPVALGNTLFGVLNLKSSRFLSEISYSIYLTHGLILFVVFTIIYPDFYLNINSFFYMLLMLPLSVIIFLFSILTYKYIECPSISLGKKLCHDN